MTMENPLFQPTDSMAGANLLGSRPIEFDRAALASLTPPPRQQHGLSSLSFDCIALDRLASQGDRSRGVRSGRYSSSSWCERRRGGEHPERRATATAAGSN